MMSPILFTVALGAVTVAAYSLDKPATGLYLIVGLTAAGVLAGGCVVAARVRPALGCLTAPLAGLVFLLATEPFGKTVAAAGAQNSLVPGLVQCAMMLLLWRMGPEKEMSLWDYLSLAVASSLVTWLAQPGPGPLGMGLLAVFFGYLAAQARQGPSLRIPGLLVTLASLPRAWPDAALLAAGAALSLGLGPQPVSVYFCAAIAMTTLNLLLPGERAPTIVLGIALALSQGDQQRGLALVTYLALVAGKSPRGMSPLFLVVTLLVTTAPLTPHGWREAGLTGLIALPLALTAAWTGRRLRP